MDKQMMNEKEIEMMKKAINEDARRQGEQFGCFATIAFAIIFLLVVSAIYVVIKYL